MLEKMRRTAFIKSILWVVIIGFVGFIVLQWGMNITGTRPKRGAIGEVNGQKIRFEDFRNLYWQVIERARSRTEGELDERTLKILADQTWNYLIDRIILRQEVERRGITVTDEELLAYIRENPPDMIQQHESFQTEGKFDMEKYLQALDNPQIDWAPVESYVRALLPIQKLQNLIAATVRVTDLEVRQEYVAENEKAKVEYVHFDPVGFSDQPTEVTEEEIRDYYRGHRAEYLQGAQRNLDYVLLEKRPSAEDSAQVKRRIQELLLRARQGEDFAELARLYSEDPGSKEKGGDLGFFGRGEMAKPFEEAAFDLKVGQISDPIKTNFGWHIIKLTDRKEGKVRASHILLKVEPSSETLASLRERAEGFAQAVTGEGFYKVAEAKDLMVKETGFFPQGNFIPTVGSLKEGVAFAFEHEVGATSPVFENDRGYYVFRVVEKREKGTRPLAEVKDRIRSSLLWEKRMDLAEEKAHAFAARLAEGERFRQAAKDFSLKVRVTPLFSRRDHIPEVGRQPEFIRAAFELGEGQTSPVVKTDKGFYLIRIVSKRPIDEKQFIKEKEALKKDLLSKKQIEAYTAWFKSLRQKAKIKDYRNLYYPGRE